MSTRTGRGPHPRDEALFGEKWLSVLREATADLSWLRTRGYAEPSSVKLVGDRYRLAARQRIAVARCACSDDALASRRQRRLPLDRLEGLDLFVDGFNVLTTVEAALAGGVLLRGRDGCVRDMASMHGNYRVLGTTREALELIRRRLRSAGPKREIWYLDKPVSNSGRLRELIEEAARADSASKTSVRLVKDPDPVLEHTPAGGVVATADSGILDGCGRWVSLAEEVLAESLPKARIVDLS
ncbi:MAG: DUF434 domain-containing protein [Verrucomicrobiales bacterium]